VLYVECECAEYVECVESESVLSGLSGVES